LKVSDRSMSGGRELLLSLSVLPSRLNSRIVIHLLFLGGPHQRVRDRLLVGQLALDDEALLVVDLPKVELVRDDAARRSLQQYEDRDDLAPRDHASERAHQRGNSTQVAGPGMGAHV
jgi:hypothetical protein